MALNVNREVQDVYYRYKMPKIATKIEGKGNGIKTVIVNMVDIAKALGRPPSYPTKYFGIQLGAQTQIDEKAERYIVNGSHESDKLQNFLDGFIKSYVLCGSCHNPETMISVTGGKKTAEVNYRCKACGHRQKIRSDRLTQFISRNPPTNVGGKGTQAEGGEEEKEASDDGSGTAGDIEAPDKVQEEEAVVWTEDVSEDARLKRANELSDKVKQIAMDDDVVKTNRERYQILCEFIKTNIDRDSKDQVSNAVASKIRSESNRLDLREQGVMAAMETLLDNAKTILDDVLKYQKIFQWFTCTKNEEENARAQRLILGGLESLVNAHAKHNLLDSIVNVLHKMYELDILEEENIIAWHSKGPTKRFVDKKLSAKVHEKCQPFLDWLRNAESESDEDDDDAGEDSDGVPEANHVNNGTYPVAMTAAEPVTEVANGDIPNGNSDDKKASVLDNVEDSDSDVDIENI